MSEGPRRGQGGEGDHRQERQFLPGEWKKGTPGKASGKRRHLSLILKNREASHISVEPCREGGAPGEGSTGGRREEEFSCFS